MDTLSFTNRFDLVASFLLISSRCGEPPIPVWPLHNTMRSNCERRGRVSRRSNWCHITFACRGRVISQLSRPVFFFFELVLCSLKESLREQHHSRQSQSATPKEARCAVLLCSMIEPLSLRCQHSTVTKVAVDASLPLVTNSSPSPFICPLIAFFLHYHLAHGLLFRAAHSWRRTDAGEPLCDAAEDVKM